MNGSRQVASRKPLLLLLGLSLTLTLPAAAQPESILVEAPWARAAPPGAHSAAGYLTIHNAGGETDRLVSVASPHAAVVELHETAVADGVARMRLLPEGIEIGPGQSVVLEPGGLHLMFRQPDDAFTAGRSVPLTLTFEEAGEIGVELPVVPIGSGPPEHHGGHGHGH
jgi:periplasmic copper chaperone A